VSRVDVGISKGGFIQTFTLENFTGIKNQPFKLVVLGFNSGLIAGFIFFSNSFFELMVMNKAVPLYLQEVI